MEIKFILNIFLTIIIIPLVYSQIYISEVDFGASEFIEIYSDEQLNLTNNTIHDKTNKTPYNVMTLIQNKSSNFYLIIGTNFYEANQEYLETLNCSIYRTNPERTQTTNGGLSKSGENIFIQLNSTHNLSLLKSEYDDIEFEEGKTLNYNHSTENYSIQLKSVCTFPTIHPIQSNSSPNNPNTSQITSNNTTTISNQNLCEYPLKINLKQNISTSKIEFNFDIDKTQTTNYTIEYWIEDYQGNIVKNKRNTTNTNSKSYTPKDFTNLYIIKANLHQNNCTISNNILSIFYASNTQNLIENNQITSSESSSSSGGQTINQPTRSYIKITNKDNLKLHETTTIQYEIYKGDSRKRTIYIYQNKHKLTSMELEKYSKVKGKLELELEEGLNNISIQGLDKQDEIIINNTNNITEQQITSNNSSEQIKQLKQSKYIQLTPVNLKNTTITFQITTNIENTTFLCYTNYIRTPMSNILNITPIYKNSFQFISNYNLTINTTKLKEKSQQEIYPLKLYCKYKTQNTNYFKYESIEFNYTIPQKENIISLENDLFNFYSFDDSYENKTILTTSKEQESNINLPQTVSSTTSDEPITQYTSNNIKTQENSFFMILVGVSLLLIVFVLKW